MSSGDRRIAPGGSAAGSPPFGAGGTALFTTAGGVPLLTGAAGAAEATMGFEDAAAGGDPAVGSLSDPFSIAGTAGARGTLGSAMVAGSRVSSSGFAKGGGRAV